jgi:hypothetical protein
MALGSGIRKKPIPDPESRGQKATGSRIRNTGHLVGGAVAELAAAAAAPAEDPAVHGERYAVLRARGEAAVGYPLGAQRPHLFSVLLCGFKPRRIGNSKIMFLEVINIAMFHNVGVFRYCN